MKDVIHNASLTSLFAQFYDIHILYSQHACDKCRGNNATSRDPYHDVKRQIDCRGKRSDLFLKFFPCHIHESCRAAINIMIAEMMRTVYTLAVCLSKRRGKKYAKQIAINIEIGTEIIVEAILTLIAYAAFAAIVAMVPMAAIRNTRPNCFFVSSRCFVLKKGIVRRSHIWPKNAIQNVVFQKPISATDIFIKMPINTRAQTQRSKRPTPGVKKERMLKRSSIPTNRPKINMMATIAY